ncbi:TetR family transcriptional regulator [Streptomyces sp. NPDC101145]|uniref:TetR family transcriptional regulator n=1 Tax=Streptomyces sp. NPDC101145 TaxID=3366112 RepID=UPI00382F0C1B
MTVEGTPVPPPLTERQEARRRRILDASVRLAGRGGFDAVQMREVAEEAEVALGTLYRYFPSKVHLLVATMRDQLDGLHATLRKRPPDGDGPAERVAETLMRAFRALQREPQLADAMVRALTFADRSVSEEVEAVSRQTTAIILDAMRLAPTAEEPPAAGPAGAGALPGAGAEELPAAGPAGAGPEELAAVRVVEHTWYSALISWLSGRASIEQVETDLRTACRLLPPAP